jgi:hypothetical protein
MDNRGVASADGLQGRSRSIKYQSEFLIAGALKAGLGRAGQHNFKA